MKKVILIVALIMAVLTWIGKMNDEGLAITSSKIGPGTYQYRIDTVVYRD